MIKKVMSLVLASLITLSAFEFAFAADIKSEVISSPMIGILTADDGTQTEVEGILVSTSTAPTRSGLIDKEATYRYDLEVLPRADGSKTESDVDGGYCSTVYLTIKYSSKNSPTEYLLTGVSGYWTITDGKASVESAKLSYGCSGRFPEPVTQSITNKSVNNHFNISTGFNKYVTSDVYGVLGANLTVNYLMGTSRRWSFTLSNNLFNS